ncbi:MAG TPA: 30S ribosome-binding factor RbfA [Steroidobacteraceae bacterium]|nr:30S ribosome-binding factor RbfA [Steroidobacteraceae bacterium]
MSKDPHRSRRIEGELQRVLSELLRREIRDPRVGSITITDVRVSPDLKHARVFYTRFDEERDAAEVQAGLDGAARFLRGLVGRSLKLRVAPELAFRPDEQLAAGVRLSSLIDSAVAHDAETHVDDGPEQSPDTRGARED